MDLLVVSPHLDDAVFGCGDLIARNEGAVVATVFAAGPAGWTNVTEWDRAAGFESGQEAVAARREEDSCALGVLGAKAVWLPFWDGQYGRSAHPSEIAVDLGHLIRDIRPRTVCIPFGLWHSDHCLVFEACRMLIPNFPDVVWMAYEDAIYRRLGDSGLERRRAELAARGQLTEICGNGPASTRKREAIACYRSQLAALSAPGRPGWMDALEPECIWRLGPSS